MNESTRKKIAARAKKKVDDRHKGEPKAKAASGGNKVTNREQRAAAATESESDPALVNRIESAPIAPDAPGVGLGEFDPTAIKPTAAMAKAERIEAKEREAAAKAAAKEEAKANREAARAASPTAGALPKLPRMTNGNGGGNGKSRTRKPKESHPCICGCGTPCKAKWAPGHDARAKGWAMRIERGIITIDEVPENERAGANLMLTERAAAGIKAEPIPTKLKLVPKTEQGEGAADEAAEGEAASS